MVAVVAAKEARKTINKRGELITDFIRGAWDYLIEAELDEPKLSKGGSYVGHGRKRTRLYQDDQSTDDCKVSEHGDQGTEVPGEEACL